MTGSRYIHVWSAVILILAMVHSGTGQAVETQGSIQGKVVNEAGNPVPDAEITLLNLETGYYQMITTREDGRFRARLLPLGVYQVTVLKTGLTVFQQDGVKLTIGDIVNLDVRLKPITFEETITVTADAPIIEAGNVDAGATVNEMAISTLPLNGRNFQDHVLLTAGAIYYDYHVQIGGQRGINNNLMMDGADNNSAFFSEQRGGTRPPFTFSQEAVREFEVLNNAYSAEFGRAGGGIINAVTKSGTNTYKGSLFYYFRDDSFVEKNALGWEYDEFEQHQFGATLGGPIIQDKLFFFIAYDGQLKDKPIFPDVDDYFSPTGDYAGEYPETAARYPFWDWFSDRYLQTHDENVLLTKIDWIINSNHHATFRHNYSRYISENGTVTSGIETYNGYERTYANSLVASINSIFTETLFNELRIQYASEKRPREPNDDDTPETIIRGRHPITFGQRTYLPSNVFEDRLQVMDSLTWILEDHELKAGFDWNKLEIDNEFLRYGGGSYEFEDIADFPHMPFSYRQAWDRTGNDGLVKFDSHDYAFFVQDNWQPTDQLTVNMGLRYDFQDHPDVEVPNPDAWILPWWSDNDSDRYNPTAEIPEDTNNWGPRIAVAWSPQADKRTVIRAGWGMFYSRTPTILVANALSNNGYRIFTSSMGSDHPDFPTYPNRVPNIPDTGSLVPDIYVFDPDFENPMTRRTSVGVEREMFRDFAVGLEYVYAHTTHLERKFDINLKKPEWDEEKGRYVFSRVKRNPDFNKIIQFTDDAESKYHAVTLELNKRFSNNYQFMASYTWSRSRDNDSNNASTETYGYDFPENMYDLDAEWGPSDFDVEHRVVASGTYLMSDLLNLPDWYDLDVSGIFTYQSGRPWTPEISGDANRDGYSANDRPHYRDEDGEWKTFGRNSKRDPHTKNFDFRLTNGFKIRNIEMELIVECFNVFDWSNWTVNFAHYEFDEHDPPGENFGKAEYPGNSRQYQIGARITF
ncbi:TonB-dependent receptor [bacterium]|nr:TonB-dependent receptor [candidate division CSSED10-310 bacterium]